MAGRFSTGSGRAPGAAIARVPRLVAREAPAELEAAGLLLLRQIVVEASTPGRGRIRGHSVDRVGRGSFRRAANGKLRMVRRGKARTSLAKASRASAPGDPPAPDTGVYRGSIGIARVTRGTQVGVRVGTGDKRGSALEFGTKTAGRGRKTTILPRPHFRPALAKVRAAMAARMGGGGMRTRVAAALRSPGSGGGA